jgi:aldose 1-epimerase
MKKIAMIAAAGILAGCSVSNDSCSIETKPFGVTKYGEKASLYEIKGKGGVSVVVSDFGCRLVKCFTPDKDGKLADITLGWNSVKEYETLGFSMSTVIGRYANRIANGKFKLDGKEYTLAVNETKPAPRNCNLHSGPKGWDSKVWKAQPFCNAADKGVRFSLVSPDGDMGFPGTVKIDVTYTLTDKNVLRVEYKAVTDKPTVINPTLHSYWNLAGEDSGNVLKQELQIFADFYTTTDAGLIPLKDAPVKGTGFDFTTLRPIGAKAELMKADISLAPMNNWYDHNFVLRGKIGEMKPAALMFDPASKRTLEIFTTEPCMQMYGAQNMTTALPAKAKGKTLCQFAGMALETQHYPDSPNHPEFPSTVLRPGKEFSSVTEFRFGVRK